MPSSPPEHSSGAGFWGRVDELVPPTRRLHDLRAHRLQLVAADRWRRDGLQLPNSLLLEERALVVRRLAVDVTLQKVRAALTGSVIVFKGAEAAAHYPNPSLRPFVDLDLLVPDPEEARRSLLANGFEGSGEAEEFYDGLHHVQPVAWPGQPMSVELHHHPNWVDWARPPAFDELFEDAVPSSIGPSGTLALDPMKHALVLAVNAWADVPLRRVLDLVDIAAVLGTIDPAAVQSLADEWDVGRIWRSTASAMDHMLFGGARPVSLRTWARATAAVRDDTVAGNHIRRLAGTFWALPPHRAPRLFLRTLVEELLPSDNEGWRQKLGRTGVALRNAFRRRSQHEQVLGDDAHLFPRRQRPSVRARGSGS